MIRDYCIILWDVEGKVERTQISLGQRTARNGQMVVRQSTTP